MLAMTEFEQQPVLIAIAPNEIAAHMLQHVLETQDIESFVLGAMANQVLFWGGLVEVRIEVRRCDYEVARAALEAFVERMGMSVPEQQRRSHCVVCGYDRAGLGADSLCPECGYPVGESAACTECGKAVRSRRPGQPVPGAPSRANAARSRSAADDSMPT